MSNEQQPAATPAPAATEGQAPAKKKAAKLTQAEAGKLGAWLKAAAPVLNQHNISPAGVARAASKFMGKDVSANSVTLVAGGIGVAFTDMTQAERIEKLENSLITLLGQQQAAPAKAA
jgi:hypothetical protein